MYIMKKTFLFRILFMGIVLMGLISCQEKPSVDFTMSQSTVVIGDTVTFTNATINGASYEWYFGDGEISTEENPTHIFNIAATYPVRLASYSENGNEVDIVTKDLEVIAAKLKLTVYKESYSSYDDVWDCSVQLFSNHDDYLVLENKIDSGNTDIDGIIIFDNLRPQKYYFSCYDEGYSDDSYYVNWYTTFSSPILTVNEVTELNIIVEEINGKYTISKIMAQ